MVDGIPLLNFIVALHNLLWTVSSFMDELVPQDNCVRCILHIFLSLLTDKEASCEHSL